MFIIESKYSVGLSITNMPEWCKRVKGQEQSRAQDRLPGRRQIVVMIWQLCDNFVTTNLSCEVFMFV